MRLLTLPAEKLDVLRDSNEYQGCQHATKEQAKKHSLPEGFVMEALLGRFQARLKPEDEGWFTEGLSEAEKVAKLEWLEQHKDAISRSQENGWWA